MKSIHGRSVSNAIQVRQNKLFTQKFIDGRTLFNLILGKCSTAKKQNRRTFSYKELYQRALGRWQRRRLSSLRPHEHIKHTSTCGAVLTANKLETAASPLHKQGPHGVGMGREEKQSGGALGGYAEAGRIVWAQRSSLGSERFKQHMGHPSPGV